MVEIKETVKELKAILTSLKTHADSTTALSGTDKSELEARIKHLNDKTQDHRHSPKKLDFDIDDLDNLDTLIGQDKATWATEKSKLEKDKKDAETAKTQAETDKQAEIDKHNKTKQEVADKINSDLVKGLTTLINTGLKKPKKKADGTDEKDKDGNIIYEDIFDKTLMDTIKNSVEEIKTKGAKADLSELQTKLDGIKSKTDKISETGGNGGSNGGSNGTFYAAITAAILGGLALCVSIYGAFYKSSPKVSDE